MRETIILLITLAAIYSCQEKGKQEEVWSSIWCPAIGHQIVISSRLDSVSILKLDSSELRILRNEIYARRGYNFKSDDLYNYFKKYKWYEPKYTIQQINDKLTNTDIFNIKLIKSIEEKKEQEKLLKAELMNKIDFQEYLDIIPQVELPLKFDCDAGFEVPEIDSEKNELILKKFKPEGATIIGKLYSNKKESAILYGYPADIFYPIISEIDSTGKEINEIRLFPESDCVDDAGYSARTTGTITKDFKVKTKTVKITWDYENEQSKKDTTISYNEVYF